MAAENGVTLCETLVFHEGIKMGLPSEAES